MQQQQHWTINRLMNLTQTDLSELLGVDRGTIRRWQNAGMPYRRNSDRTCSFDGPVVLHWRKGREFAADHDLSPYGQVIAGLVPARESATEFALSSLRMEERMGMSRSETVYVIGKLIGCGLISKAWEDELLSKLEA